MGLTYAFDLELYPNFFSAIFINVEDTFDEHIFLVYGSRNDLKKLKEFVSQKITLVGYNNLYFDNVILNAILEDRTDLFSLSQTIIDNHETDSIRQLRYKKVSYKSIDFKELVGLDISLKQAIIVLEWSKIQELPFPPTQQIKDEDVPIILDYNRNDILPLIKLWEALQPEIELRKKVTQLYKVDVSTKSEGQLPNIIFEKLYSSATNRDVKSIKTGRTNRDSIPLKDCMGKNISFETKQLKGFLDGIKGLELKQGFKECLQFAGLTFNLGVGGIHTQDKPGVFESDPHYQIIDADVTSFYPNIILLNDIKPAHLSHEFLDIFRGLVKERIEAKAKGDKIKADILKISVNAVFGKLGNPDYWLYDMQSFYSVTISGQLYLLSLIELLTLKGIEVISANTDGVTSKVKKSQLDLYYKTCQEWETRTGFELEFTPYKKYVRRDVNNYVTLKDNGKLKRKGIFETKDDVSLYRRLMKSYTPDIIPQALTNYFIYGIPVLETLKKSSNIFDFLMSQRIGKTFEVVLKTNGSEEKQQRINRYYVSTDGGILFKRDGQGSNIREISILSNAQVQIANEINRTKPFSDYKVNLAWYQAEIEKIVRTIEVEQLVLF